MTRITRWVLAGLTAASLAACSDSPSAPATPTITGTYVLHTAAGTSLPAKLHEFTDTTGTTYGIFVVADTLTLGTDGRYAQRAHLELRDGDFLVFRSRWTDRGVWVRTADSLHFDSDLYENVRFSGSLLGGDEVEIAQDLTGEAPLASHRFRKSR